MNSEIDLVYVWCYAEDPVFWEKRQRVVRRYNPDAAYANNACRYRFGDVIRYSLRSVERYAPWIGRIYIVVDDDQHWPDWPEFANPKIRFVRLSEIIPAKFLPTFSSDTIDQFVAFIPGLADRFLYACDDFLFNRETPPEFFFAADGFPYCDFGRKRSRLLDNRADVYNRTLDNAESLIRREFGNRRGMRSLIGRMLCHNIDAYRREDYQAAHERFRKEIEEGIAYPFRDADKIQRILYSYYQVAVGHGHVRTPNFNSSTVKKWWRRLLPSWAKSLVFEVGSWEKAEALLSRYRPYLMCFNDGAELTETEMEYAKRYLQRRFPLALPGSVQAPGGALISVIIPVYRVEKWLDRCVRSVLSQDHENLEALLIDDGSPDRCGELCDRWAERDSRVRVFHKANGGLSDARNFGLDRMRGEYFTFVDSDDYLEKGCLSSMLKVFGECPTAGYVECSLSVEKNGRKTPRDDSGEVVRLSNREAMEKMLYDDRLFTSAWGKLFRKALKDRIRFPVGRIYEELYVLGKYVGAVSEMAYLAKPLYVYSLHEDSITTAAFDRKKSLQHLESSTVLAADAEKIDPSLRAAARRYLQFSRMRLLRQMEKARGDDKTLRSRLRGEVLRGVWPHLLDSKAPVRDKFGLLSLLPGMWFYYFAWKFYERVRR